MWITLVVIIGQVFAIQSLPTPKETDPGTWTTKCPSECTCYKTAFGETLLDGEDEASEKNDYPLKEGLLANEPKELENGLQVKAVACIISSRTQLRVMFASLPVDIQVLTLMQSHDSPNITLGKEHFSHVENIRSLSIQGGGVHKQPQPGTVHVGPEDERPTILFEWDAFSTLQAVEIVELEHVEFEAAPDDVDLLKTASRKKKKNKKKREAMDDDSFFVIDDDMPNKKVFVEEGGEMTIVHELVFLPGEEESTKIVPYEVYKVEKESQNSLESFYFLKNLRTLRLKSCRIPPLSKNTLAGLDNLRHLSIKNCNVKILPNLLFAKSTNIETLVLAENDIMELNSEAFAGLFELQHLDLSYNNITHVSETSFAPMPSLQMLNLRGNALRVYPSTFEVMNATRRIYLGDPRNPDVTVEILAGAFKGLRHLHHLTVHGLRMQHLDSEILRGTKTLSELVLKGQVHEISFDAFAHHPKLRKLDLRNCQIRQISVDSFQSLSGLQVLDLSFNELEEIPPGVFDSLQSLKELWLNGNDLQELPDNIFSNLHAKLVRLDENPWHCTCDLRHLNPSMVNKVKSSKHPIVCDKAFDKPSLCHSTHILKYEYDRVVAPRCKTPLKFEHWSVFDVLRKELRCDHRYRDASPMKTINFNHLNLKQLARNFEKYATAHTENSDEEEHDTDQETEEDPDGGELIVDDESYQPRDYDAFLNNNAGQHPFSNLKENSLSLMKSKLTMSRKTTPFELENETIHKEDLQVALEQRIDEIVEALQRSYDAENQRTDEANQSRYRAKDAEQIIDLFIHNISDTTLVNSDMGLSEAEATTETGDDFMDNEIPVFVEDKKEDQRLRNRKTEDIERTNNEISNDISAYTSEVLVKETEAKVSPAIPSKPEKKQNYSELLQDPEYTSKLSKKSLKLLMENARLYEKQKKVLE